MGSNDGFSPDWISAPGDTIADILRERELSRASFTDLMGFSSDQTVDLIEGRETISIAVARRLTAVLGASVEFWMTRDAQYRRNSHRLDTDEQEWLRELPLGDMFRFGWITPTPRPSEELSACLRFFNVSSVLKWRQQYASLQEMTAFRTSSSFDSRIASVAAWLRQGEVEATGIDCQTWNPDGFQDALWHIRSLTLMKDPCHFLPKLQQACAKNGVAVVVVRSPSGCRASGATRFISLDKALLQLSFRYLTDDQFWFTFFHEAGHLLLHGERKFMSGYLGGQSWILEGIGMLAEEEEREANQFAAHTLIPTEFQSELSELPTNTRDVIRFAQHIRVSPGIVVGQLQHLKRIRYSQLNGLKRRFTWVD